MEIKKLEKKDMPTLAKMLREYWQSRSSSMSYSQEWTKKYLRKGHSIEIKKEVFLVAKEKKEVVGNISVIVWEGRVAELRDFLVKPEKRGKGISRKLFAEAILFCKKNNVRKVFLLTFPNLEEMLERKGFTREGMLHDHFACGEDLIIMSRFLK